MIETDQMPKKPNFKTLQIETLPREVLKWIQSLDLTYSIKNVKKDFNHGFLVAQILSRYSTIVEMHRIDNGHTSERRKDNWKQIADFVKKDADHLPRLNIESVEDIYQNKNNEVLMYIIKMYQNLTGRQIVTLEEKAKFKTDIDDKNKSYLLKDTGELELLKKDEDPTEKKEEQKNQKAPQNIPIKTTNVMLKAGELKPISSNVNQISEKKFNPKISETKSCDRGGKILRQTNLLAQQNNDALSKSTGQKSGKDEKDAGGKVMQLSELLQMNDNLEQDNNKNVKNKNNPFELLEETIARKIGNDHTDVLNGLKVEKKFIYTFFKNAETQVVTVESLADCLSIIIQTVEDYFNILHEQVNEYVSLFLLVFGSYLNIEILDPKFETLHDFFINFFIKSKKNTNEEMYFVFKNIIIKKIFEVLNSPEYNHKIEFFCDLIFRIFDPNEKTQIEFFKLFKEYIIDEEVLYECFKILHGLFNTFPESFIDICLFYIVSGLSHTSANIRYNSLFMLFKYVLIRNDFYYTFEKKLTRLSISETSRDNAYLIVNMSITVLRSINNTKVKNASSVVKKSIFVDRGDDENSQNQNIATDMNIPNKIIYNVFKKFAGDDVLTLILLSSVSEVLYDNIDLIKIFLGALFLSPVPTRNHILFGADFDEKMNNLINRSNLKSMPDLTVFSDWNYALLFKGYILWLQDSKRTDFTLEFDYMFLNFCLNHPLQNADNEIWRKFYSLFYKIYFKEMKDQEKCGPLLKILERFLFFDVIQKPILEDCYEFLQNLLKEIFSDKTSENIIKCQETISAKFKEWNTNTNLSFYLRETVKKILDTATAPPKEKKEEINNASS